MSWCGHCLSLTHAGRQGISVACVERMLIRKASARSLFLDDAPGPFSAEIPEATAGTRRSSKWNKDYVTVKAVKVYKQQSHQEGQRISLLLKVIFQKLQFQNSFQSVDWRPNENLGFEMSKGPTFIEILKYFLRGVDFLVGLPCSCHRSLLLVSSRCPLRPFN